MATQDQIEAIHTLVNELMNKGWFDHVDGFILGVVETSNDFELITSVIGFTAKAKDRIPYWRDSRLIAIRRLRQMGHDSDKLLGTY